MGFTAINRCKTLALCFIREPETGSSRTSALLRQRTICVLLYLDLRCCFVLLHDVHVYNVSNTELCLENSCKEENALLSSDYLLHFHKLFFATNVFVLYFFWSTHITSSVSPDCVVNFVALDVQLV